MVGELVQRHEAGFFRNADCTLALHIRMAPDGTDICTRLADIAAHYDEEVEYAVAGMSEAIGPIMIVGLTVVVGFFALAIFLPMWNMTQLATG